MATPREPFTPENAPENLRELFHNLTLLSDDEENGRGVNFNHQEIDITAPVVADTQFSVNHNLERIPSRFLVVLPMTAGQLYMNPLIPWTETTIYLKCTIPSGRFKILVY